MALADFTGTDLGKRLVEYDKRDVVLYALAVGARETELELVFERDLKVLPAFGLTLGLWSADAAGRLGMFHPEEALHGAQTLEVRRSLPTSGRFEVTGRVAAVRDKGKAAIVEVVAECEYFSATYSIFLPGRGGWGGDPGPRAERDEIDEPAWHATVPTLPQQAALYRLTGDRHLIHIDGEAARAAGLPGPILHGLCTLGIAARELAAAAGRAPWELTRIEARFSAPVLPGQSLELEAVPAGPDGAVRFRMTTAGSPALRSGAALFTSS